MFEIRIRGRSGQIVLTAAELLSVAAFAEGRQAQAIPAFGSQRAGAPVVGFCRIDDEEIRSHGPVAEPDAVIIQDDTLLHQADVFAGLGADGYLLVDTSRSPADLGLDSFARKFRPLRVVTVPATELALAHLGRPMPGVVLLGAFAALTDQVRLESVVAAVRERFGDTVAAGNIVALRDAYGLVRRHLEEAFDAQTA